MQKTDKTQGKLYTVISYDVDCRVLQIGHFRVSFLRLNAGS
jgi:hypothetical protein